MSGILRKKSIHQQEKTLETIPSRKWCQKDDYNIWVVFKSRKYFNVRNNFKWDGDRLNTETQATIIGLKQANIYCRYKGLNFIAVATNNK